MRSGCQHTAVLARRSARLQLAAGLSRAGEGAAPGTANSALFGSGFCRNRPHNNSPSWSSRLAKGPIKRIRHAPAEMNEPVFSLSSLVAQLRVTFTFHTNIARRAPSRFVSHTDTQKASQTGPFRSLRLLLRRVALSARQRAQIPCHHVYKTASEIQDAPP